MTLETPLRMVGAPGSPYTRKMRGLLRYRRIPVVFMTQFSREAEALPVPRVPLLPTFYRPAEGVKAGAGEGELLPTTDSTPLLRRFERAFAGRSVLPPLDPRQPRRPGRRRTQDRRAAARGDGVRGVVGVRRGGESVEGVAARGFERGPIQADGPRRRRRVDPLDPVYGAQASSLSSRISMGTSSPRIRLPSLSLPVLGPLRAFVNFP